MQNQTRILQRGGSAETSDCPSGYKLTGGGCHCSDASLNPRPIAQSRPNAIIGGTRWVCACLNGSDLASAVAYCARNY
jgi:hypothetical protein